MDDAVYAPTALEIRQSVRIMAADCRPALLQGQPRLGHDPARTPHQSFIALTRAQRLRNRDGHHHWGNWKRDGVVMPRTTTENRGDTIFVTRRVSYRSEAS
jgi:hypothetical protein